jgi:hypothetical protein
MTKKPEIPKYHPPVFVKYGKISLHTAAGKTRVGDDNATKYHKPKNIILGGFDPLDPTGAESDFTP